MCRTVTLINCDCQTSFAEVDKELIHAYFLVAMPLEPNIFNSPSQFVLGFPLHQQIQSGPTKPPGGQVGGSLQRSVIKIIYCRAFKGKQAKVTVLQSTKYFPDILEKVNVITRFTRACQVA